MCQWVDSLSTLCQSAPQSEHATFSRQRPAHPRAETSSRRHIFRLYQTVERPPVPSRRAAASLGLAIGPARRHGWEPTSRPSRVSRHVCGSTLIRYRPCSCAITPILPATWILRRLPRPPGELRRRLWPRRWLARALIRKPALRPSSAIRMSRSYPSKHGPVVYSMPHPPRRRTPISMPAPCRGNLRLNVSLPSVNIDSKCRRFRGRGADGCYRDISCIPRSRLGCFPKRRIGFAAYIA